MVKDKKNTSAVTVYNSYTGDKIGTVPQSTQQDVKNALDLAKRGEANGKKNAGFRKNINS